MPERKIDEFVFVLLAGLVLIIMFMVGFPAIEQLEANQTVNMTNVTSGDITKFITLGDFTVSYSIGTETIDSKNNFDVYKSYFDEKSSNLLGSISDDKLSILKGATLTITVDETNNLGPLIVSVNGVEVYRNNFPVGTQIIPIDKSLLKSSNVVSITTDFSSWMFWRRSYYHIKSAKFEIQYQGSSFKDFTFYLDEKEFNKFKFGKLTFTLNPEGASTTNNLLIKINNERFFYGIPPLISFSKEITKPFLRLGNNKISFSVDPTATYNLQDVTLTFVISR
jgi:hypothetical protein